MARGQTPSDTGRAKPMPGALELGLNDSTSRQIAQSMAKDLVRLRKAEATYYSSHKAFAYNVTALAPFAMTPGNQVAITQTDGGGYRAVATNPALPGAEFEAVVPAPSK
jgi:hypothetical protein